MKLINKLSAERRPEIFQKLAEIHENNRRLKSTYKLRNLCQEVIVANKSSFCLLATQTGTNPLTALAKQDRIALVHKLAAYKSTSGEDYKSSCQLLALLVVDTVNQFCLPQCDESYSSSSDFTHLEQFINDVARRSQCIQRMTLRDNVPLSLRTDSVSRNIFLQRLGQMRSLRILDANTLVCNSDNLNLIALSFPRLSDLAVHLDTTLPIDNHRPGLEALMRLPCLANFKFASSPSEITRSEVQLVSLSLFLMPRLRSVGRNLSFSPDKAQTWSTLKTAYHNPKAVQFHAQGQHPSALQEFFAHTSFWTPETSRLLPNLHRMHIIGENDHIPDNPVCLSLYHNHRLQTVRAFTPNLRTLSLFNCDLSGVPSGGLLALCPNLVELHLIDCLLAVSNVALDDEVCRRSPLQVLTVRGAAVDGLVLRLLQAPQLQKVQISVKSVQMAEVLQLVWQLLNRPMLNKVRVMNLKGENFEQLVSTARAVLPMAEHIA